MSRQYCEADADMDMTTLERIHAAAHLRFLLYGVLSRRIGNSALNEWAGPAPNITRLIRSCDVQLEKLWNQRRRERIGEAARIVFAGWEPGWEGEPVWLIRDERRLEQD